MERSAGGDGALKSSLSTMRFRSALSAMAELLLPICCVSCERLMGGGEAGIVCGHCWSRVEELPYPRCERCGHPVGSHTCLWCEILPPFVRAARSFCWVGTGTGGDIIHALKYGGWTRAAISLAQRMSRLSWPVDVVEERSALVPVPLAASRRRERGFNQSALLADELSRIWGIPAWDDALERRRATRSQTELTPGERLSNVAGAFRVRQSALQLLPRTHVILVDDVVTTGATLRACANTLFAAGTRIISYLTFGRAPASGDRLLP